MLYIVISVLIVLVVMNVFMLLVLRQMVLSTGKQIEKDAVRLFAVYDGVLEKKSQKLEKLDQELAEKENRILTLKTEHTEADKTSPVAEACVVSGRYRDDSFAQDYQMVKEHFKQDPEVVVDQIRREQPEAGRLELVEHILGKFTFDNCYEMMTLPADDQDQILKQFLEPEELALRAEFTASAGTLEAQPFYQWLLEQKCLLDTQVELRVGNSLKNRAEELSKKAKTGYDPEICEGFQVKAGNRLYDYSI